MATTTPVLSEGLSGLDYQHFYEAFSFPLWRIVLLWPPAPSGGAERSSHAAENQ